LIGFVFGNWLFDYGMVHSAGVRVTYGVIFRGYIPISMVVVDSEDFQVADFIVHLKFQLSN
jgi:hypothetical protein